jgi:hypothetical protein
MTLPPYWLGWTRTAGRRASLHGAPSLPRRRRPCTLVRGMDIDLLWELPKKLPPGWKLYRDRDRARAGLRI